MSENKFNELKSVISELREKCPWDKKQTLESLKYNPLDVDQSQQGC